MGLRTMGSQSMTDANAELVATFEEWRPVLGYEGRYMISSSGKVMALERRDKAGKRWPAKEVAQFDSLGYRGVHLSDAHGKHRNVRVHVLLLEAFVGPRPPGFVACHWDDNRSNNDLANLRWDTPRANRLDATRNGRNKQTAITHCPQGHPLEGKNLEASVLRNKGHRRCRACGHETRTAWRQGRQFDKSRADARYRWYTS
ncbi:NUMOD4 motif-containing HNH endonuclease [Microbacterium plantarum]|uniref:NUMOD4 motif-containing HNH endonuclease n=1 Tax=Microbacterium plantarum TaxID=1816425 RepID=UPI002B4A4BFF|nr:NUMOD4 motif-containing HNH endonuclease [Microbacterium plantarum]WRK16530.1 NUMOD4 motif-containing HNH endonuclease [Microbacterium plantarum]